MGALKNNFFLKILVLGLISCTYFIILLMKVETVLISLLMILLALVLTLLPIKADDKSSCVDS